MAERKILTTASGATISYVEYPSRQPSKTTSHLPKSGLVILHGGLKSSRSHIELAEILSSNSDVSVYLPDRRGRGLSSLHGFNFSMSTEVEDLRSLLQETGAKFVLGVSGGAGVALEAALELSTSMVDGTGSLIQKVVIFEPQLVCDDWDAFQRERERFKREIDEGKIGPALITALKMSEMGPWALRMLPRWVLDPMASWGQAREEAKGQSSGNKEGNQNDDADSGETFSIWKLAPSLCYDYQLVAEMRESKTLERSRALGERNVDVLLMSAVRSPAYLQKSVEELEKAIPKAKHLRLEGLDHLAFENRCEGGRPEMVFSGLMKFLVDE